MKPIKKFQIGKKGLTNEVVEQLKKLFKNYEIIKVEFLKSFCRDKAKAKEIAEELVDKLGKNYTYRLVGYVLAVRRWRKAKR